MKKIENKETALDAGDKKLTYAGLCKLVLNQMPQGGFTYQVMKERGRIEDVLNKTKTMIELEDADYKILMKCLDLYTWGRRDPEILKFMEAMKNIG